LKELDATIQPIMKSFVKERLLVMSREEVTNEEIVEVAHEALIRRWGKLKELLNDDRQFLLWRQHLGLMLSEWHRTERNEGALLRGAPLDEARRRLKDREKDLNQQEREFIQQSELTAWKPRRWIAAVVAVVIVTALAALGWKLWDDRDESQINKVLSQSSDLVRVAATDIQNPKGVNDWLDSLVIFGRSDEALEAVRKIDDVASRTRAMVSIVEALAMAGKTAEALEAAREIGDANFRSRAMVSVAEVMTKNREVGRARSALDEAERVAQQVSSDESKSMCIADVAKGLAKLHYYKLAREMVDRCLSNDKLAAYTAILRQYYLEQHPDQAELFEEEQRKED
jgi:hypothetical protein